jgi:GTP-binding protein
MMEGNDPIADMETINEELYRYSEPLSMRPRIVAANKCDCIDEELFDREGFESYVKEQGWELVYVSAVTGENLEKLVKMADELLEELPEMIVYESEYTPSEPAVDAEGAREINITLEKGVYMVEGEWLYNLMGSINFDDRESLMYFQRVLRSAGVIEALEKAGCTDGDTVNMYDFEFDFVK